MAFTIPWAPTQTFQPNPRLVDLIRQSGQDAANAQLRQGEIQEQMWGNLGQTIAGIPGTIAKSQQAAIQSTLGQQAIAEGAQKANDLKSLDAAFAQPGSRENIINALPGHLRPIVQKQFADADEAALKVQSAQQAAESATNEYVFQLADTVKAHNYDPAAAQLVLSHAKQTFAGNKSLLDQVSQFEQAIQANPTPDGVKAIIDPVIAARNAGKAKPPEPFSLRAGETRFDANGKPIAAGAPTNPTEASLALDSVADTTHPDGTPLTKSERAGVAVTRLRPFVLGAPGSAEAFTTNARTIAEQQKGAPLTPEEIQGVDAAAVRKFKDLGKDPDAAAQTAAQRELTRELTEQRLADLKEKNKPIEIGASITTTMSGRPYLDLGEFQTSGAKEKAREAAIKAGIMPVNKDVADGLKAADTTRSNLKAMLAQISGKLPKDATGRILTGPANKLQQFFQTDADLAAWGSWRTAAIQAVQGLAEKGMGLRLNRSEIDLMLENDIPQITDTWDTAKQRIANLTTMLDNKEKAALTRDRQVAAPSTGPAEGDVKPIEGFPGTEQTFRGGKWIRTK